MAEEYVLESGQKIMEHSEDECFSGIPCVLHAPSAHPLASAPRLYNRRFSGIYRRCEHGLNHPDYDDFAGCFALHVCDGCCVPPVTYRPDANNDRAHACTWDYCPVVLYFDEDEHNKNCPLCGMERD